MDLRRTIADLYEEKAKLEEVKKANASALAANSKIANLNTLLKQARDEDARTRRRNDRRRRR